MCSLHVFLGSSRWISGPGHHQSGYIVHLVPGSKPAEAALAELFVLPDEGYGSRGGDLTTDVIVWSMLSSGHMASFDRKTCTPPINGPEAIAGKLEAWTRAAVQAGHGSGLSSPRALTAGSTIRIAAGRAGACGPRAAPRQSCTATAALPPTPRCSKLQIGRARPPIEAAACR
jgi:hypothetical protein